MLKIKENKIEELVNFGFRKGPKYWNHVTENVRVERESRELSITGGGVVAYYALGVPNVVARLVRARMVENG